MWKPDAEPPTPRGGLKRGGGGGLRTPPGGGAAGQGGFLGGEGLGGEASTRGGAHGAGGGGGGGRPGGIGARAQGGGYRVVAGLTLYKVQMNIYLLDFHKREGDQFTFMVSQTYQPLHMVCKYPPPPPPPLGSCCVYIALAISVPTLLGATLNLTTTVCSLFSFNSSVWV